MSHFARDARMMPPRSPMLEGLDAIRSFMNGLLAMPRFRMTSRDHVVEVSSDAALAWSTYLSELTVWDAAGRSTIDTGRTLVVWRKEPDGAWRIVADIWNEFESSA